MNMKRGFTLIEILVSVAIFSVVMTIALGALLAMSVSNRKAETLKSVINNLNFSLDSMSRSIRTGTSYHCDISYVSVPLTSPHSCASGANSMTFLSAPSLQSPTGSRVSYRFDTAGCPNQTGCIERQVDSGAWAPLTSPEVVIQDFSTNGGYLFYVVGAEGSPDTTQPKVTITVAGYVQVSATQQTPFNLQTSITQRLYDQ